MKWSGRSVGALQRPQLRDAGIATASLPVRGSLTQQSLFVSAAHDAGVPRPVEPLPDPIALPYGDCFDAEVSFGGVRMMY